ncbi:MAG: MFS transporter [Woeseiaceae bacterium]|nr:MFS transporter [Woeseiaceae bacterium]
MSSRSLFASRNGRLSAFGILYISEGVPYGFSSTAMVAFMRMEGVTLEQIGLFVAALFLPWSFKWAWAPLIDIVKLRRYGGRKAWIVTCTMMMIITLIVTAIIDFSAQFNLLLWMIVLNNFFCATQDVAIDSLAVSVLRKDERASGNGFMFGGQYLGIALGGGGAIFISSLWGFEASLLYVSAMLLASMTFCLMYIEDPEATLAEAPRRVGALEHFLGVTRQFGKDLYSGVMESGAGPKLGLLFAILPKGAMALAYGLLATLQVDYGLSEAQISQVAISNSAFAGIGCVLGGLLGDKLGVKKVVAFFFSLGAVPTLFLAIQISTVGLSAIPIAHFYAAIMLHGLIYGLAYGVQASIFMGLTNPAVAATQFTAYMALSNLSIVIANYWQGQVAGRINYSAALYIDCALIILAVSLLPFLTDREEKKVTDLPRNTLPATESA